MATKSPTLAVLVDDWRRDCTDTEIIAWATRAQRSCIAQDARLARAVLRFFDVPVEYAEFFGQH